MRIAFPAGGGAQPPGGGAAFIPKDLVDGGAVLIGQGRRVGCRVAVFLGVWERGREGWRNLCVYEGERGGGLQRRKGRKDGWSLERKEEEEVIKMDR